VIVRPEPLQFRPKRPDQILTRALDRFAGSHIRLQDGSQSMFPGNQSLLEGLALIGRQGGRRGRPQDALGAFDGLRPQAGGVAVQGAPRSVGLTSRLLAKCREPRPRRVAAFCHDAVLVPGSQISERLSGPQQLRRIAALQRVSGEFNDPVRGATRGPRGQPGLDLGGGGPPCRLERLADAVQVFEGPDLVRQAGRALAAPEFLQGRAKPIRVEQDRPRFELRRDGGAALGDPGFERLLRPRHHLIQA
jgi:hypothetical protein